MVMQRFGGLWSVFGWCLEGSRVALRVFEYFWSDFEGIWGCWLKKDVAVPCECECSMQTTKKKKCER